AELLRVKSPMRSPPTPLVKPTKVNRTGDTTGASVVPTNSHKNKPSAPSSDTTLTSLIFNWGLRSFKYGFNRFCDPFGRRHLNTVECLGADYCKLPINLRDGSDPGILWQIAHTSLHEFDVRHHGPGIINHPVT